METNSLHRLIFKLNIFFMLLSILLLFMVQRDSPQFVIVVLTLGINIILAFVMTVYLLFMKKRARDYEE